MINGKCSLNSRFIHDILSSNDGLHGNSVEHSTYPEVSIGFGDSDVSALSPCGSPWVSHNKVVLAGCGIITPADRLNSMIHGSWARSIIVDTCGICAESVTYMKRNGGRTIHEDLLEATCWPSGSNCSCNLHHNLIWIVGASCVICHIRVSGVKLKAIIFNVGISTCEEATVAASVSISPWAVNELLLSKHHRFVVFNSIVLLDGPSSGEWPAAAALPLILDRTDNPHISPVDRSDSCHCLLNVSLLPVHFLTPVVTQEHLSELLRCKIWEHIHTKAIGDAILRIVVCDGFQLASEDFLSSLVFLLGGVALAVLGQVTGEDWIDRVNELQEGPRIGGGGL
jgi:hypothetical protein